MNYVRTSSRQAQRGQSMVELMIVLPVLLFLILAVVQAALLYRAKATLDYATFEAARAGAVTGVDHGEMKEAFSRGITPLFATKAGASGLLEAAAKARLSVAKPLYFKMTIISPTPATWNEFKERDHKGRQALPNDSLAFRDASVGRNGVNIQDANVLKIKITYRYPLIVPFVDRVLGSLSEHSELIRPNSFADRFLDLRDPTTGHYTLPLDSYAVVRMQSPIVNQGNLR